MEEMTEPMRKLSSQGSFSAQWAKAATSAAVPATPRVERTTDWTATGRAADKLVPKPP